MIEVRESRLGPNAARRDQSLRLEVLMGASLVGSNEPVTTAGGVDDEELI